MAGKAIGEFSFKAVTSERSQASAQTLLSRFKVSSLAHKPRPYLRNSETLLI